MTIKNKSSDYIKDSADSIQEAFADFLKRYYKDEIIELSNSYPEKRSLLVKFGDLDRYNADIADKLLEEPDRIVECATQVLRDLALPSGVTLPKANLRIVQLSQKVKIRHIRSEHINKLVSVEGLVTKATEVRPMIVEAAFECPFCHHIFSVVQTGSKFEEPYECPQEDGGCGRKVQRFTLLKDKSKYANAQKMRLQESQEELRGGELPQALEINLEDDITGVVTPGDRVIITGILRTHQRVTQFGKKLFFDIYLDGNSLELKEEVFEELAISEEDERRIMELKAQPDVYEKLIRSIAPSIYGYEEVKEAILLQMCGGVPSILPGKVRSRGDIHVLLVGDPSVAKSQFLSFTAQTIPRGLYQDGSGSSGAGLTAAAVQDREGGWSLEAGTLVLADRGLAAIDELDKMNKSDRGRIHTAMEQQIVLIAKAGINAKLNSRCAILAAANPIEGRFNKYEPISKQINMPSTLLSRFDLIYTMKDSPSEDQDRLIAAHIINLHAGDEPQGTIPVDLFKKYIAYTKRIKPTIDDDVKEKLINFYVGLRKQGYDEDAPVPVTVRQFEAVIRLAEASARARLSATITAEDAERVINVVTYCLKQVSMDPETGKLDVDWVVAGTTKTRRDRARSIREIIKKLEKDYGEEIPIAEVIDCAEEEGMDRDKAEEIIEVMKRDGILFSPEGGVVKFMR